MTDTELHWPMSCPFCGGFPVMTMGNTTWDGKKGMMQMRCQGCDARGPAKLLPLDAAMAWDEIRWRRRMTEGDCGDPDDDGPSPTPSPVTPKLPEMA